MSKSTIEKLKRRYVAEDLDLSEWENLEDELKKLEKFEIVDGDSLEVFLHYWSELFMILQEQLAWKYIDMTRFADNEDKRLEYSRFYAEVYSKSEPYKIKLMNKYHSSRFRKDLDSHRYENFDAIVSNTVELFREENLSLEIEEKKLASEYAAIIGSLTVDYRDHEYTLSQLSKFQLEPDRSVREEAWMLSMRKLKEVHMNLEELFDRLLAVRVPQAENAGFSSYRDYMHRKKNRFVYSVDDIIRFHESAEKIVVPFVAELNEKRRKQLGLQRLRPWDLSVEPSGKVLKPFRSMEEFVQKAIRILEKVDPEFGRNLFAMKENGLLDLENRKGKAPGGYNYPLDETGAPFIFMNATGTPANVRTILHESGHAMHSFATANEKLIAYRHATHEAAELASMSMELLTMDHWDEYYSADEVRIARLEELTGTLSFLPWCMVVDSFQQWIYTNPDHSSKERDRKFAEIFDRFNTGVEWTGLEDVKEIRWLLQPHIFTNPFYYIEYGIAQLGALAIYKNYRERGPKAIEEYKRFLSMGYSRPLDELFKSAGIEFDFSEKHLSELIHFVGSELVSQ